MARRLPARDRKPLRSLRTLRFERLRARQVRWREKRAARREIFTRATPIASYLLFIARLHRLLDITYIIMSILVGARFLWRLGGIPPESMTSRFVVFFTDPWLRPIESFVPALKVGEEHWLEPSLLFTLIGLAVVSQLSHRIIHLVAYRQPLIQIPGRG